MKIFNAQQVYMLLSQAKLDNLTTDEKYKVIKSAREFKKITTEFEDFIKETQENKELTDEAEVRNILEKEATREVEIKVEPLGEIFNKLLESNNWNVGQIIMLEDYIK